MGPGPVPKLGAVAWCMALLLTVGAAGSHATGMSPEPPPAAT